LSLVVEIEVIDRQSRKQIDVLRLQRLGERASKVVLERPAPPGKRGVLAGLSRVEVVIVSDDEIARVHEQFMDIPGPTDVVTFDHGEIVISADRAEEEGDLRETGCHQEIALYIIHGMLHLHGFDDRSPEDAAEMRALQGEILGDLWGDPAGE